jgi:TolA-binding protein
MMNKGIQAVLSVEAQLDQLKTEVETLKKNAPVSQTESLVQMQLKYEFGLKILEKKMKAYKAEFINYRALSKT